MVNASVEFSVRVRGFGFGPVGFWTPGLWASSFPAGGVDMKFGYGLKINYQESDRRS